MHRILHIVYSFYHGGAEHLINTLIAASGGSVYRHSVCVLTSGGQPLEELSASGVQAHVLGKKTGYDPALLGRLIATIRKVSPDMLHLHNVSAGLWGTFAVVAGRLRLPIVRTEHRPWLPGDMPLLHRISWPVVAGRAGRIIAVSAHAGRSYREAFPRLAGRIVTVHNGIDPAPFGAAGPGDECRDWFGLPREAFIVGTVGRLVPVKNHSLLLDSFLLLRRSKPEAHLAVLGEGPLEGMLRRKAAEAGAGKDVSILPASPSVARFLGALDLFALSSDSEGLPLTLLEACASGLPVVSTSVGGVPEVIEDGVNGLLCERGDAAAMAARIGSLAASPDRAAAMGEEAGRTVRSRFTADICHRKTCAVYDEVLESS